MGLNKIQADKAVAIFTAIFLLSIVICIWFFAHPIIKNSEAHLKPILFALTLLFTFPILGILFHFMSYAVEKPRLIQRIERIKNLPELNRKASASLFVEVFDTLLVLLMVVLISGLIYWGTHDFTHIEHSISVSAGLISLFAIAMWANRNEPTFSSISKSITVTTIIGCFAIGLLFSLAALDGPVGVAEILAWLVPLMWVYLNLKDFMESLYPDRSNPGYWASSYRVLWRASDEILVKIRRNSSASQALAVVLSLSIFLLPSEFGFLIPPEVKDMFQTVWRELGYIEISNQHIGYIALTAFIFFSCSDFAELAPDLLPEHWVLIGPTYNALLKCALSLALVIVLSPLFLVLFFVGYTLIGSDLALVVGFFTFPQWSQRIFAIFIAAQSLSFDDPNEKSLFGEQLALALD